MKDAIYLKIARWIGILGTFALGLATLGLISSKSDDALFFGLFAVVCGVLWAVCGQQLKHFARLPDTSTPNSYEIATAKSPFSKRTTLMFIGCVFVVSGLLILKSFWGQDPEYLSDHLMSVGLGVLALAFGIAVLLNLPRRPGLSTRTDVKQ